METGDQSRDRDRRRGPGEGLSGNRHRHSGLCDVIEDVAVEVVDLEGRNHAGDERHKRSLPERLGTPRNPFRHPDDVEGPLERIDAAHEVLGAVQDGGVEPVEIHILRGKVVGVDGQDHEMDIFQGVAEPGDVPYILERRRALDAGFQIDHVEDRTPRTHMDVLSLAVKIMFLFAAAENHPLRGLGDGVLDHGPGYLHELFRRIAVAPLCRNSLEGKPAVNLDPDLRQERQGGFVDPADPFVGERPILTAGYRFHLFSFLFLSVFYLSIRMVKRFRISPSTAGSIATGRWVSRILFASLRALSRPSGAPAASQASRF